MNIIFVAEVFGFTPLVKIIKLTDSKLKKISITIF